MTNKPIRVLIAEDSPAFREFLVSIIQSSPDLQVVGTARNGLEAVRLAKRLEPDIVSMDIFMPEMDGFEATRQIMQESPRPIVMVSSGANKAEKNLSFNALQAGALSILAKPALHDPPETHQYLINQLKLMSEVKVVKHWNRNPKEKQTPPASIAPIKGQSSIKLIAIAASTGGPGALATILKNLPENLPLPILIVQHITPGFSEGMANWLNGLTPLSVSLARHNQEPQAGQVFIAPDGHHMAINSMGRISLSASPPIGGLRPSANYLFHSVAKVYGKKAIGIILTGMGNDGAEGLLAMHNSGAYTIAQNRETCVVYGMPAVAIEWGAAEQILAIENIAAAISKKLSQ